MTLRQRGETFHHVEVHKAVGVFHHRYEKAGGGGDINYGGGGEYEFAEEGEAVGADGDEWVAKVDQCGLVGIALGLDGGFGGGWVGG